VIGVDWTLTPDDSEAMATRDTRPYSISMPPDILRQAEELARRESRTVSELMSDAFLRYQIERAEESLVAAGSL
jgi:predicted transcriptional regulator